MSEHGHDDCQWCAGYGAAIRDTIERGEKARAEIAELRRPLGLSLATSSRLHGKAQGVDLMLSYAREMEPKP